MGRFIEGEDRQQVSLMPECLDDYIEEVNPVRVIDAFVGELDLVELGFEGAMPATTGRPAYHPATLLKVYIYGHLNRIQSVEPSSRARVPAQRRTDVVHRASGAGLQDHRRLPAPSRPNAALGRGESGRLSSAVPRSTTDFGGSKWSLSPLNRKYCRLLPVAFT
jgi:hypothetical protein